MCPPEDIAPAAPSSQLPPARAWLFIETGHVPDRWAARGVPVVMVPLLPEETAEILAEGKTAPAIDPDDEVLVRLAAQGLSNEAISRRMRISPRSVQRRLAHLRDRYGVASKAELSLLYSRGGFK